MCSCVELSQRLKPNDAHNRALGLAGTASGPCASFGLYNINAVHALSGMT